MERYSIALAVDDHRTKAERADGMLGLHNAAAVGLRRGNGFGEPAVSIQLNYRSIFAGLFVLAHH